MSSTLTNDSTLGQLAALRPAAIPVFERLGLDYCCGGGRTLAAACQPLGLTSDAVMAAIVAEEHAGAGAPERVWADASMTELADHIQATHHAFVRDTLQRLGEVVPRVVAAHADRHPELVRLSAIISTFTEEMHDHMIREERVLFPWLRRLERPSEIDTGPPWSVRRPISCMVHDHDDAGAALSAMRTLTNGFTPPAGACATYRSMLTMLAQLERDTHLHVHKENNLLFPAGIRAEERHRAASACAPGTALR